MIESLDQPTLLVLSALAVLFGVPLSMLLWIAAQSIQMRVLRRRLGEVEAALFRLQNAGDASAPRRIEDIDSHGLVVERAPTPIAASESADAASSTETAAPESESESEPVVEQTEPESTVDKARSKDERDWLGVTDLPGVASAAPAVTDTVSDSFSAGAASIEEAVAEASAPDTPARRWLRQAAVEAEDGADGSTAAKGDRPAESGVSDAATAAADAGATETPSTSDADAMDGAADDGNPDEEGPA